MSPASSPVLDHHGRIMFFCRACGAPITYDDFFELGLRMPDAGEAKEEFCDAELLDGVEHVDCLKAARAG